MNPSIVTKSIIASLLNSIGIVSMRLNRYSSYNFVVLMYHRVLPKEKAKGVQAGMYVVPETFENHQKFLKKHFKIAPLSEFCSKNTFFNPPSLPFRKGKENDKKRRGENEKPLCFLTFDDGWYDFFEYAFPILKTYQIPATVFLPTDFIGTTKYFWTDRLIMLFSQRQRAESKERRVRNKDFFSNYLITQLENLNGSQENQIEEAIRILKTYRDEEIKEILSSLSKNWNLNPEPLDRSFLSWDEVREMAQSGLITFGSHTASHRILTTLKDEEIEYELIRSKEKLILNNVVDKSFIPFCYPNGNYNEKIAKMVRETGYSLAVTTENGWNPLDYDQFALKRIGIHQDIASTEAMFGCRIVGIF